MSKDTIAVGDSIYSSPVGSGTLTGITEAGYPQVNYVAVARLIHKCEDGQFIMFDPVNSYRDGKYVLFIDDEREPTQREDKKEVVVVRSSKEAIQLLSTPFPSPVIAPQEINFDHDLGGSDTSMVFIDWLINQVLDGKMKLPTHFKYSVHSQNPIGVENIKSKMDQLIDHCFPLGCVKSKTYTL